jgi:hypothetical protein
MSEAHVAGVWQLRTEVYISVASVKTANGASAPAGTIVFTPGLPHGLAPMEHMEKRGQ